MDTKKRSGVYYFALSFWHQRCLTPWSLRLPSCSNGEGCEGRGRLEAEDAHDFHDAQRAYDPEDAEHACPRRPSWRWQASLDCLAKHSCAIRAFSSSSTYTFEQDNWQRTTNSLLWCPRNCIAINYSWHSKRFCKLIAQNMRITCPSCSSIDHSSTAVTLAVPA